MIDTATENLVPLRDIPKRLPFRANGKRLHISAVYRWTTCGVRGVMLETVRIGGQLFSSTEAIQIFAERLSQSPPAPVASTPKRRARDLQTVKRRVAEELGIRQSPPRPSPGVGVHR
jgi:hypothetical protein